MKTPAMLRTLLAVCSVIAACAGNAFAQSPQSTSEPKPAAPQDRAGHASAGQAKPDQPREPIPAVTDADRAAAFPDVEGHAAHDDAIHYFVLFDQLEWQFADSSKGLNWDARSWIGRDRHRLWLRSEGDADSERVGDAEAHVMYGRAFARWWDVVGGVRQDFRPGPAQTWAAVGVQGLAPQWFEIEATAYVGESGRTAARFEVEYELLLTNRLMLQPLVEINVYGKSIPERGIGAGLSTAEFGLRMRYEIRRELAPYVGLVWHRKFAGTANHAREAGDDVGGWRAAAGMRLWF